MPLCKEIITYSAEITRDHISYLTKLIIKEKTEGVNIMKHEFYYCIPLIGLNRLNSNHIP